MEKSSSGLQVKILKIHELIVHLNFYLELNIYKLAHKEFENQEDLGREFEIQYLIKYATRNYN